MTAWGLSTKQVVECRTSVVGLKSLLCHLLSGSLYYVISGSYVICFEDKEMIYFK